MRIVHLQHPYIPGMGYQENYLPARQKELGHDVHIITTDVIPEKFRTEVHEDYPPGSYSYKNVPTERCRSITYDTEAATIPIGAVRKIKNLNPDVIHSHRLVSFLSLSSICANAITDTKLVFDIHVDNDNFHLDEAYKKIGFRGFRGIVLPIIKRSSDGFIAVNPYAQRFLKERLGIHNSHYLPLGADIEQFQPSQQERTKLRSELNIDEDEFVVITAGNLNESKKIEEIIRSIPSIENRSVRLIILGSGDEEYLHSLHELTEELEVSEQVIFHDFVEHEELSKFYNAADIGVWPGKLGITIIEAVSCGLPIIVSDTEATDFLTGNENGIPLSEISPTEIATAIQKYAEDPELQDMHSSNAYQLAQNELSWKSIAKKSIEIYRTL